MVYWVNRSFNRTNLEIELNFSFSDQVIVVERY